MQLFIDHHDHIQYLLQAVASKPNKVVLASFGIYAGLTADGRDMTELGGKFLSKTRDLLESMRHLPNVGGSVNILIGVGDYKSCKGKGRILCLDCEKQYILNLVRLMNHVERFPEFSWRFTNDSHVKCALFSYNDGTWRGVAGSRNFTDSNWAEVTFTLDPDGIVKLNEHFGDVWNRAKIVTSDNINNFVEEQGLISEDRLFTEG